MFNRIIGSAITFWRTKFPFVSRSSFEKEKHKRLQTAVELARLKIRLELLEYEIRHRKGGHSET